MIKIIIQSILIGLLLSGCNFNALDNNATSSRPENNETSVELVTTLLTSSKGSTFDTNTTTQLINTASYADDTTQNITTLSTWESNDTSRATVNSNGVLTTISGGDVTIKATYKGLISFYKITIKSTLISLNIPQDIRIDDNKLIRSYSINLTKKIYHINKTNKLILNAYVQDINQKTVTLTNVSQYATSISSDENIVTVKNGVLSPKSIGEANVTITLADFTAVASVYVYSLDTTFNQTGYSSLSDIACAGSSEYSYDSVIDNNGKILSVGTSNCMSSYNSETNKSIVVLRYNNDGSLDTTFNSKGFLKINSIDLNATSASARGVALDNNKIVITGTSENNKTTSMILLRLNNDGSLDTTFNSKGYYSYPSLKLDESRTIGNRVAIDENGRILVFGSIAKMDYTDVVIWCLLPSGKLDTNFNNTGIVSIGISQGTRNYAAQMKVYNNTITVSASTYDENHTISSRITRYLEDGTHDSTFNNIGEIYLNNNEYIFDLEYTNENKLLILSSKHIIQYDPSGNLDTTFGINGLVDFDSMNGYAFAIDKDNNLLVVGSLYYNGNYKDIIIKKFNLKGELDTTFGDSGSLIPSFYPSNIATNILLDENNNILISGGWGIPINYDLFIFRYKNNI